MGQKPMLIEADAEAEVLILYKSQGTGLDFGFIIVLNILIQTAKNARPSAKESAF